MNFLTRLLRFTPSLLVLAGLLLSSQGAQAQGHDPVIPTVALPSIPERSVSLLSYGAVGDGVTLNTSAFAAALSAVADQGGGRVVVPAGIWLTGPILLRSRVDLHLEEGALILFTPDRSQYPLVESTYEGTVSVRCMAPLSGNNLEDVAITGTGVIDGSGEAWRPVKKDKLTASQWRRLLASGGVTDAAKRIWYVSEGARIGNENSLLRSSPRKADLEKVRDSLRPVLLSLVGCRRVLLEGVTFQNSPAWNLHPLLSEDLVFRKLKVLNPWYAQNGDGLDLESCRRVLVENCHFDVGDDAICLKSGRDAEGRKRGRPTEQVLIRDCVVAHGHGGFVIGSEMSGGVRDVVVERCTFLGTDVGLRFKSTRGRGGVVERIRISDIRMLRIPGDAILFDLFYMGRKDSGDAELPAITEETPAFRDIHMSRIVSVGSRRAALFQGLPEMPLQDIVLEDSSLEADIGIRAEDVRGLSLRRVSVQVPSGSSLSMNNVADVHLDNVNPRNLEGPGIMVDIDGERTRNVRVSGQSLLRPGAIEVRDDVPKGAVRPR